VPISNAMRRTVLMLILCAIVAAAADAVALSYSDIPQKDTPRKLQEAWLRFHESGLCQEVDAAFVFENGGMQIWSRIGSDKSYSKFQELFAPLRNLHRVKLYTNRSREGKESDDGDNPPPSLWQNYELRANLGGHAAQLPTYDEDRVTINPSLSDPLLKQRLLIYGEQVLSRNRIMEHYALDLLILGRAVVDADIPPDIRSKAIAISSDHAKSLEKNIGKLASALTQAIPRPAKGENKAAPPDKPDTVNKPLLEEAAQIYQSTQSVARRIHCFIYPEYYTVELEELRKPIFIESLRTLQRMVLDFQKTLAKSGRKQAGKNED
jgi:hypothetical protein